MSDNASSLSRNIGWFANTFAGLLAFLLTPLATHHVRPWIMGYLQNAGFSADWAGMGAWVFIALLAFCTYFGFAAAFQMISQVLFYRGIHRSGY